MKEKARNASKEWEATAEYQPFAALRLWYWADRCARSALMSLTSASRDATWSCRAPTCEASAHSLCSHQAEGTLANAAAPCSMMQRHAM